MDDNKERCIKIKFGLIKNLRNEVPEDEEVLVYEDGMIFIIGDECTPLGCMKGWDPEKPDPANLRKLSEQHGLGIIIDEEACPVGDDDDEDEEGDEEGDEDDEPDWMNPEEEE